MLKLWDHCKSKHNNETEIKKLILIMRLYKFIMKNNKGSCTNNLCHSMIIVCPFNYKLEFISPSINEWSLENNKDEIKRH